MTDAERALDRLRALAEATEDMHPTSEVTDAVMTALDAGEADALGERLARMAAATTELDADEALGDSVMAAVDPIDSALARAARRTATLLPSHDIGAAVVDAIAAERVRTPWPQALMRSAYAALTVATVAAAASVALSFYTQRELDADVMAAVDSVEVAE
jgi:hypothetical protein